MTIFKSLEYYLHKIASAIVGNLNSNMNDIGESENSKSLKYENDDLSRRMKCQHFQDEINSVRSSSSNVDRAQK